MAKDKENDVKKEKIKIKFSKSDIISLIVLAILMISYFVSPDIYLVTTARYGMGTEQDNNNVKMALGDENTEEKFLIYFQWYNVIHELGHGILRYNSKADFTAAEEEQIVNDFAVAYWLHYGEEEKILELSNIVQYATEHIKSDATDDITYMEFAEKNWNKPSFNTFNNYGWFQFSSVKEALNKKESLEDVLKKMGIDNVKVSEKKTLVYSKINEEVSKQIIDDAVANFHKIGLEFPNVYQKFNDDPNANYSKPWKNFFGIYNFID